MTSVSTRSFGTFVFASLIAAAIAVIISAVLQAALTRGAALAAVGDPVDTEASYQYGFKKFGSVLWISILVGLVVGIGFILLIIPGIIFLTMLAVTIPALIVEDQRGTAAMGRSWNLVKGHFWHVLGTIVVAALITGVVGAILGLLGREQLVPPVDLRIDRADHHRAVRRAGHGPAVRRPPCAERAADRRAPALGAQQHGGLRPHLAVSRGRPPGRPRR